MAWGGSETPIGDVSKLALAAAILWMPGVLHAADGAAQAANSAPSPEQSQSITMAVPLVWGNQVLGDVIVQVQPDGSTAIESQSLRTELGRLLNELGNQRLDSTLAGNPFVSSSELQRAGFDIDLNIASLELLIGAIDPPLRPVEPLVSRGENSDRLLPSVEPADFSAYLNTNVSLFYRDQTGVETPDIYLFGAARHRNVAFEFDGGFTRGFDGDYRFYRRAARAVYDEPGSYRRWSAGDLQLEMTGALRTPFLAGVALEKSRRT